MTGEVISWKTWQSQYMNREEGDNAIVRKRLKLPSDKCTDSQTSIRKATFLAYLFGSQKTRLVALGSSEIPYHDGLTEILLKPSKVYEDSSKIAASQPTSLYGAQGWSGPGGRGSEDAEVQISGVGWMAEHPSLGGMRGQRAKKMPKKDSIRQSEISLRVLDFFHFYLRSRYLFCVCIYECGRR